MSTAPQKIRGGHGVMWLALRQLRRGAVIVTVVCAGMSALVAGQYQSTFSGEMSRRAVSALAENPAIRVLFGPAVALDDAGGFTVWRTGTPVMVLAGVWLMLAAIRITRGEEDAGRWNLLLAGRFSAVDVLLRCAAVVTGAALLISVAIGIAMIAVGTDATGAVLYALGVLGVTAVFGVVGLLAAQIMPTRPAAAGAAAGVLVTALLLRMLSDGVSALAFTAWMSPYGLMGRVAPYAGNDPMPLAVLAGYTVLVAAAAVAVAHRRDLGAGWVGPRNRRAPRLWLLGSVFAFACRRAVRALSGWTVGIGAYFLIFGALIASILDFFDQNPRFAELASAAGFAGLHTASGFAAALFGLLAIPTGLYGASRLAAWVADERAQRWTTVLAGPVSGTSLLGCEILVTAVGVLSLHLVAAVAMKAGAVLTGTSLGWVDVVGGALNTVPVAWLAVGAAALAVGFAPGAVTAVGAVPVVGGFLLNVIADSIGAPSWVSNLSPFVHIAATPAEPPHWWFLATFVVIAGLMTVAGLAGLRRRDIAT